MDTVNLKCYDKISLLVAGRGITSFHTFAR